MVSEWRILWKQMHDVCGFYYTQWKHSAGFKLWKAAKRNGMGIAKQGFGGLGGPAKDRSQTSVMAWDPPERDADGQLVPCLSV